MNSNSLIIPVRYSVYIETMRVLQRFLMQNLSRRVLRVPFSGLIRLFGVLFLTSALAQPLAAQGAAPKGIWLRVDTRDATLTVMKGDKPQEVFSNIAIGRFGKT